MLKAASYLLQAITIVALLCASVIRAKTPTRSVQAVPAALRAGLQVAAIDWIDDAWAWKWNMAVERKDSVHQTFRVAPLAGARAIRVENIFGSIEVTGGDGDGVQMDVDKIFHAESNEALERAQKEVILDVKQDPGLLGIEVKHLSRCAFTDCWRFDRPPYVVEMNFRLSVPRDSDLILRTIQGRSVRVRDVTGTFPISNVNGGVTMDDVAGSGTARTINGPIKVSFQENPRGDSRFASVNGGVDLYFAKNLSADFRFRTFGGNVYSDFPVLAAPLTPVEERRGAVWYFRTNSFAEGRVGAGGPVIRVESLHGDVRILEKHD